jgi:hypothetical protein
VQMYPGAVEMHYLPPEIFGALVASQRHFAWSNKFTLPYGFLV